MRNLLSPTRTLPCTRRAARTRRVSLERLEGRELLTGFNFADFSTTAGLNLVGSASTTVDNRLRLTPAVSSTGGAWCVADKEIVAGNFETTFQFKLSTATGGSDGSDGFAFVIQNSSPTELRAGGGALGYDGMPNSVAVEFDTWLNNGVGDPYNDPSQSHISVHTNATGANGANQTFRIGSYYDTTAHGFLLDNAQVHTARLSYTPGTLKVFLDNLSTPVLTVPLDLGTTLGLDHGRAWVGFTAASGGTPMNQDISSWSFSGDNNVIVANPTGVVEGAASTSSALMFTIHRLGGTVGSVSVNWATADGSANAGSDYVAASGQVVFQDGQSQATVQVTVNGDNTPEPNETFKLNLSTTTPGYSAAGGLGTILNDDTTVSVSDASLTEGDGKYSYMEDFVAPDAFGLAAARNIRIGPDGNIYVASHDTDVVKVFEPGTGRFLRDLGTSGGELDGPWGMTFGPDGRLFVGGRYSHNVVRFNIGTGAYDVFVSAAAGGGLGLPRLAFGPDGNLYASSRNEGAPTTADTVKRYNGATGAYIGDFVTAGSGGLDNANGIAFGPDGNLYVCGGNTNSVLRYNGQTGSFIGAFIPSGSGGLSIPSQMLFHTDGLLYVCSGNSRQILRFSASTGAFVDIFASGPQTHDIAFSASGEAYVSVGTPTLQPGSAVLLYAPGGRYAALTVSLSQPVVSAVGVNFGTSDGSAIAGSDYVVSSGTVLFAPGETTKTVLVPIVNDALPESTESFTLNLSNATGATITDGQGVGTIHDDDATKFYVVNDASSGDRTYEYGLLGASVENYGINSGNTAPRGAVSTAVGTIVWVADANKKVYVYNTGGGLLGSWTAGSLTGNASVEGIATNGTDVWLVDGKQDKVFRYTNAASLLSGSPNAASSFSLNSGNADPKDLVTDGTSIWVVNDSSTDKVFKYSLTGSLLGSWTITGAGTSPTGITLDPTGGGTLWTVDSGTDRVYQFDNARGLTSGSLSPSTSFALAAGNTNPQGIADPPMPAPGTPRAAVVTGTSHPSGQPAAHHRRAFPGASKSTLSAVPSTAAPPSILGARATPILIPLTPATGQDLTPVAAARSHTGTKRTRAATRA